MNPGNEPHPGNKSPPGDRIGLDLETFLADETEPAIGALIGAIARTSVMLAGVIRRGPLDGMLGESSAQINSDGDVQKALDLLTDQKFTEALREAGACAMVSEEREQAVIFRNADGLVVAIDPLDGSSNIDTNVSIGTIFSILPAKAAELAAGTAFDKPGHAQLGAGFVIYGPQTAIVFTTGAGTHVATLDVAAGQYYITRHAVQIPEGSAEFAINASNYRSWYPPVQAYIDDCLDGSDGPRGRNFNMRWVASLVADVYRILARGGIYLYPADSRKGYEQGRLRQLYEVNPVAMLIEQAGGGATDGVNRILDLPPRGIHARAPLVFGSLDKVDRVRRYHTDPSMQGTSSPLFGQRGLLRG